MAASWLWQLPLTLTTCGAGAWGVGALWFGARGRAIRRAALAAGWAALCLFGTTGLWLDTPYWLAITGIGLAVLLLWWHSIRPRHGRDWAADVARLLHVERQDDRVRLGNVRNFEWRTREDFTPRWETREYQVDTIVSTDLVVSYWMGPTIAHTLVSFGFADGRYLVFSVEVRRLAGGHFSAIGGLFRQCELVVVAADERDIVRTRSNVRHEDVYVYRLALPTDEAAKLFHAYLDQAEALIEQPRFYNTLTANCTTLIYDMVKRIVPGVPRDYRLLASGYLPEYLYDLGALDTRCPMSELRARGYINARAIASDAEPERHTTQGSRDRADQASPNFSLAIRRGLPTPPGTLRPPR